MNRNYQVVTNNIDFLFRIGPQDGIIGLISQTDLSKLLSITLVIQVNDSVYSASTTTCNLKIFSCFYYSLVFIINFINV